jgi:hypothetical protein
LQNLRGEGKKEFRSCRSSGVAEFERGRGRRSSGVAGVRELQNLRGEGKKEFRSCRSSGVERVSSVGFDCGGVGNEKLGDFFQKKLQIGGGGIA